MNHFLSLSFSLTHLIIYKGVGELGEFRISSTKAGNLLSSPSFVAILSALNWSNDGFLYNFVDCNFAPYFFFDFYCYLFSNKQINHFTNSKILLKPSNAAPIFILSTDDIRLIIVALLLLFFGEILLWINYSFIELTRILASLIFYSYSSNCFLHFLTSYSY